MLTVKIDLDSDDDVDENARAVAAVLRWVVFGTCVMTSWAIFWFAHNWWFLAPLVVLLALRRPVAGALFLLCTPLSFYFLRECNRYAAGDGAYVPRDDLTIPSPIGSIDPVTRVLGLQRSTCGTHDNDYWMRQIARRACIPVMYKLMGPPPGAYRGPYPTKAEALDALAHRDVRRPIVIGSPEAPVRANLGLWYWDRNVPDPAPMAAAYFKKDCLIVRVPRDLKPQRAAVYLIDAKTGRMFGCYWDQDAAATALWDE
jgi:hypothetical protein